ncbi:Exodeoxyribonuclease V alpha chain [Pantoea agglomerans]|uniref:Exodeoxyribonuclease V alpha chain n=1 Tax=Enterobacter agglomerans TaxID=549 RepID=A0A379ADC5_ENTAG|nr:Exodeoxyribonuclease V alpha chain [Pantoea agglomerans]
MAPESQPGLLLAAACVSADAGEGHVCLPLSNLCEANLFAGRQPALAQAIWHAAGAPEDWTARFADWSAVSDGSLVTPLVLSNQRLYLHRLWQSEGRVANFFAAQEVKTAFDMHAAGDVLNSLFDDQPENWQKIAAAVALTRKTAVISGGPGTGKTTTVAKLLAAPDSPESRCTADSAGGTDRQSRRAADRVTGQCTAGTGGQRRRTPAFSCRSHHAASPAGRTARHPAAALPCR